MPISPIVQQHQQSIVQQSSTPEQLSFNKEFGDAAYELLSAKYPRLIPYVVTFKVLDVGVEDSEDNKVAVGTFVINRNAEVEYIPVVLQDGAIISCEMIYNKQKDTFKPLIAKQVKDIVDDNTTTEHALVKNPNVENTEQVYKSMFRPPMSSRPLMASSNSGSLLEALPDAAKKQLYDHFANNPEILAKVAAFYPVEALAEKLAPGKPQEKEANEKEIQSLNYLDKVIKLEDLTKEAADMLSDGMKSDILENGYAIAVEIEEPVGVIPRDSMADSIEKVLNVQEFAGRVPMFGTGSLLKFNGTKLEKVPAVFAGDKVITNDGMFNFAPVSLSRPGDSPAKVHPEEALVVADFQENVSLENLKGTGLFTHVTDIDTSYGYNSRVIAYPSKMGNFKFKTKQGLMDCGRVIDGNLHFGGPSDSVCFTNDIDTGCIDTGSDGGIFPMGSYVTTSDASKYASNIYVKTLQQLINIIKKTNIPLQIKQDGPDINLINRAMDKTAKFKSEADLVQHLVTNYNFDKVATDTILKHKSVYLIKSAFDGVQGSREEQLRGTWNNVQGSVPGMEQEDQGSEVLDESLIEDMAEFQDPDMLDTGMIASLAHTDDIKSLLIDSNHIFDDTVSEVGKSILLFSVKKESIEEQYGREEFSNVMHKLRNVFTTLGHLVFDMNEYINNRSYQSDEI